MMGLVYSLRMKENISKQFWKAYLVLHEPHTLEEPAIQRQAHSRATDAATLALSQLATCCLLSHTVTAANWWQMYRIKHRATAYVRGVIPQGGREVSLALHSGTRTGRGPATTSCDDTRMHALNSVTIKRLLQTSFNVVLNILKTKRERWAPPLLQIFIFTATMITTIFHHALIHSDLAQRLKVHTRHSIATEIQDLVYSMTLTTDVTSAKLHTQYGEKYRQSYVVLQDLLPLFSHLIKRSV